MTRTIIMIFPVPQEGEQLGNINHVIRALIGPVVIDWRDEKTIEITLTDTPEKYHRIIKETKDRYYVDIRAIIYKKELVSYESLDYCIGVLHDLIAEELESN